MSPATPLSGQSPFHGWWRQHQGFEWLCAEGAGLILAHLAGAGVKPSVPVQALCWPGHLHHGPRAGPAHLGRGAEPQGAGRNHLGPGTTAQSSAYSSGAQLEPNLAAPRGTVEPAGIWDSGIAVLSLTPAKEEPANHPEGI